MENKPSFDPSLVDDRAVQGETNEVGKLFESHPLCIQPLCSALSETEVDITVFLVWPRRTPTRLRKISGNTTSLLKRLHFGLRFYRQRPHRDLPDLAMSLQLKPIFEKRLQHG